MSGANFIVSVGSDFTCRLNTLVIFIEAIRGGSIMILTTAFFQNVCWIFVALELKSGNYSRGQCHHSRKRGATNVPQHNDGPVT